MTALGHLQQRIQYEWEKPNRIKGGQRSVVGLSNYSHPASPSGTARFEES